MYVTGKFKQTGDFGPVTLTANGSDWDGFIVKLDAAGGVSWANRWGTAVEEAGTGVDTDAAGNVYVAGARAHRDATGQYVVHNNHGIDILKFGPTGAAVWAKWVNTRALPTFNTDLTVDDSSSVFVSGAFNGTVDFDPGPNNKAFSSGNGTSGFVLKLASAGNYVWASTFSAISATGNDSYSKVGQIALDASGNVIVGGQYKGIVDFQPGNGTTTLPAVGGVFVVKLNGTGGLVWAKAIENASFPLVNDLETDTAGNIYLTGYFTGTSDFDPGPGNATRTSAGGNDVFVLKLSASGTFSWAETFGGAENDIGYGIAVQSDGTIHLVGRYRGTVDFDPDPNVAFDLTTPGTFNNFFLVKLRPN